VAKLNSFAPLVKKEDSLPFYSIFQPLFKTIICFLDTRPAPEKRTVPDIDVSLTWLFAHSTFDNKAECKNVFCFCQPFAH
jgi:hypothetical protein